MRMFSKILMAKHSIRTVFITVLSCFIVSCQTTSTPPASVEVPPPEVTKAVTLPPGYIVCIKTFEEVLNATSKAKEYLLFRGLSQQGIMYLFFLGKTSYSVFFMDAATKAYCTSVSLVGKIVEAPGTET
jgi:hypothetical protein